MSKESARFFFERLHFIPGSVYFDLVLVRFGDSSARCFDKKDTYKDHVLVNIKDWQNA